MSWDLSKQFWCPVDGTKNSISKVIFQARSSNNSVLKHLKPNWCWTCIYLSSRYKKTNVFLGPYCLNPPSRLHHEPTMELTALPDLHLQFTIISWSFVVKYNIQKLNLCSTTGISKTAWINACLWNFFLSLINLIQLTLDR